MCCRTHVHRSRRARAALVWFAFSLLGCRTPVELPTVIEKLALPLGIGSVRFAVIGDSGTGGREQREIAERMVAYREQFPFDFVLMLGDNLYGSERPGDYQRKFSAPYAKLLDSGVDFYAALGNHDEPSQIHFEQFNMDGQRYYTFSHGDVRFFALDSGYMDENQLRWLERELESSDEEWKICFFHHPLYSSGKEHGPSLELRRMLEPIFIEHGVDVVFAGHEHFYERLVPQHGITHFISGGAAKLRPGDIRKTEETARGFDRDHHFVLVEIEDDRMEFRAISRTGTVVDAGVLLDETAVVEAPRSGDGKGEGLADASAELGTDGR